MLLLRLLFKEGLCVNIGQVHKDGSFYNRTADNIWVGGSKSDCPILWTLGKKFRE